MPRIRKQKIQEPLRIEINFDAELEGLLPDPSMADSRFIRVTVPNRQLREGTMALQPPDATAGGKAVSPVRVRSDTQVYGVDRNGDGYVEFRAELDVTTIEANWGEVEHAAVQSASDPLPFRFSVGIVKESENDPDVVERPGLLTINLNAIHWYWTPVVRDEKGNVSDEGPESYDQAIELDIDGTDRHGFRLRLELQERQRNGDYKQADADFVHYLSPDHKLDFEVLKPEKIPWEIAEGADQRQITTLWWLQAVPPDHKALSQLPLETTIRTRAYPGKSIVKHVKEGAPKTQPPGQGQRATREIPLVLGLGKWLMRILEPKDMPLLLSDDKPWETGFPVKAQVFCKTNKGEERPLKNKDVTWKLLPGKGGVFSGGVLKANAPAHEGEWHTNDNGEIEFTFVPAIESALFLHTVKASQFFGEFEVRLKTADPMKQGAKVRSEETPDDDAAPSAVVEWAPKFDLALFKVPYFTDEPSIDPDKLPSDEDARAWVWEMDESHRDAYRLIFRTGGTIALKPVVPIGGAGSEEIDLKDYRLRVGASTTDKSVRKVLRCDPVTAEGGTPPAADDPNVRQPRLEVDASPAGRRAGIAPGTLVLQTQAKLQPQIASLLEGFESKCLQLEKGFAISSALSQSGKAVAGDNPGFAQLGKDFRRIVVNWFATRAQEELKANCRATLATLEAAAKYLGSLLLTWSHLGDSVNLHRTAYRRMIDNSLNFLFDFVFCDEVGESINKHCGGVLTKIKEKTGIDLSKIRQVKLLHESIQTAVLRGILSKLVNVLKTSATKLAARVEELAATLARHQSELRGVEASLAASHNAFTTAVSNFSRHSDTLAVLGGKARALVERFRALAPEEQAAALPGLRSEASGLMQEARRVKAEWSEASRQIRDHIGDAPNGARKNTLQWMSTNANAQAVEIEMTAVSAQRKQLEEAMQSMKTADDTALASASNVGGTVSGANLEAVTNHMNDAVQKMTDRPPAEIAAQIQKLQDLDVNALGPAAPRVQAYKEGCERTLAGLQSVASNAEDIKMLGVLHDPDSWTSRVPATLRPTDPALDFSSAIDNVRVLEEQTRQSIETSVSGAQALNNRLAHHANSIISCWKAQRDLMAENLSDGVKGGQEHIFQFFDEMKARKDDPPPVTFPEGDGGVIHFLKWCLFEMIDWFADCFRGAVAWCSRQLGKLPELVRFVFWLLMYVINLVLRAVALLGAKVFEMLVAVLDFCRSAGGYRRLTSLNDKAYSAASDMLKRCGSASPDGGEAGSQLFTFPYLEFQLFDRWKECGQEGCNKLRWEEQYMDQTLRTGYEDYYPRALGEARDVCFKLAKSVLGEDTLRTPPLEEAADSRLDLGKATIDRLEEHIAGYSKAYEDAQASGDKAFSESLRRLSNRSYKDLSSVDIDLIADWIGWVFSWLVRVAALLVGLFTWWSGAGLVVSAGGLLAAASIGAAVTALVRLLASMMGAYAFCSAYPRDVVMLQAAFHASLFLPKDQRFNPGSTTDYYNY